MRRGCFPILGFIGLVVFLLVPGLGPRAQTPPPPPHQR